MAINENKAYILGLLVGGGDISSDSFRIVLPYDKWGEKPQRMAKIARDILTQITDKFKESYGFDVNYTIGNKQWTIEPLSSIDTRALQEDLRQLGLPYFGNVLTKATLTGVRSLLSGHSAESFLSGIFDTRASLTETHRRFDMSAPVVSIEIPGKTQNFEFVVQLCSWLTSLGSVTDQILYNHPTQHSAADPLYKGWRKGFKIRFLVRSFLAKHSFAMRAKAVDLSALEKLQTRVQQVPCRQRKIKTPKPVSIHSEIKASDLPNPVRSKLFFHYHHICALMGCPYAPVKEVEKLVGNADEYVTLYPRCIKGIKDEIYGQFREISKKEFSGIKTQRSKCKCAEVIKAFPDSRFPDIKIGLAYLFAKELKGKRHRGPQDEIIQSSLNKSLLVRTLDQKPFELVVLVNPDNDRGVLISSNSSKNFGKKIKIEGLNVIVK